MNYIYDFFNFLFYPAENDTFAKKRHCICGKILYGYSAEQSASSSVGADSPSRKASHSHPLTAPGSRTGTELEKPKWKKLVDGNKDILISKGKRKGKAKAIDAVWENQKALILHKCCTAIVKTLVIINQF